MHEVYAVCIYTGLSSVVESAVREDIRQQSVAARESGSGLVEKKRRKRKLGKQEV